MISGNTPRTLAALALAWASCAGAAPKPTELDALLARLARPAPATTAFVEVRYSRLLAEPLQVSGELAYRKEGELVRRVTRPFRETTTIRADQVVVDREGQKRRRFALSRAPELRGVLASFGALLAGDRATLERHFTPALTQAGTEWTLVLVPRDARSRKRLVDVTITGSAEQARCFSVNEVDGDASVMWVGPAPAGALPPERAALERLCRG